MRAQEWWLSCPKMTVCVQVDDNDIIRRTPAIVRKFRGKNLGELWRWFEKISRGATVRVVQLPRATT